MKPIGSKNYYNSWIDWSVAPKKEFWKIILELLPYWSIDKNELSNEIWEYRDILKDYCSKGTNIDINIAKKLDELKELEYVGQYLYNGKNDSEYILLLSVFSLSKTIGYDLDRIQSMIYTNTIDIEYITKYLQQINIEKEIELFLVQFANKIYENKDCVTKKIKNPINAYNVLKADETQTPFYKDFNDFIFPLIKTGKEPSEITYNYVYLHTNDFEELNKYVLPLVKSKKIKVSLDYIDLFSDYDERLREFVFPLVNFRNEVLNAKLIAVYKNKYEIINLISRNLPYGKYPFSGLPAFELVKLYKLGDTDFREFFIDMLDAQAFYIGTKELDDFIKTFDSDKNFIKEIIFLLKKYKCIHDNVNNYNILC